MVQTRKTGSTISCLRPAPRWRDQDRARVPVMLPRKSDSDMRRDGSRAAPVQPNHPVDERGRVHGVPDLDDLAGLRIIASNSVPITAMEEKWRWQTLAENRHRIRGRDKRRGTTRRQRFVVVYVFACRVGWRGAALWSLSLFSIAFTVSVPIRLHERPQPRKFERDLDTASPGSRLGLTMGMRATPSRRRRSPESGEASAGGSEGMA